ncbi:MAG TPA: hotdog fold thioesterase [Candidatus Hydrogenedentes bacterium]|nr:hotdog fold thioesterase [Candidatus Hydrogenedentota bacterium]
MDSVLQQYFEGDAPAAYFGMTVERAEPGLAIIRMPVDERHRNGVGVAHGAVLFALGDFALAVASNAGGQVAVAVEGSVHFHAAVPMGSVLKAVCRERYASGRLSWFDIEITREDGGLAATMQGLVTRRPETVADIVASRRNGNEKV